MLDRLLDEAELVPLPLELLHGVAEGLEIDLPPPSAEDLGHPVGEEHTLEVVRNQEEVNITGKEVILPGAGAEEVGRLDPKTSGQLFYEPSDGREVLIHAMILWARSREASAFRFV